MDLDYLTWAFRRSLVATLLFVIASLVIWLLTGAQHGWAALISSAATWSFFFWVYIKDPRNEERHYNECRDHHE